MNTYAVISKDKSIQASSSSGGVFSLFAMDVLKRGGVVLGVAMTENCYSAEHIVIDKEDDLYKLKGSKYLQSSLKNCFYDVKKYLLSERVVLFSGTPCQVGALKLFLEREYDNLITIEVICHGTPPQRLWKKYADFLENKYHSKIKGVYFRDEIKLGGGISNEN